MNLEGLLNEARKREAVIAREYDIRTAEYQAKKLHNDKIRRNLENEEDELMKQIPLEHFQDGSEWGKVLEEIRALERLIERSE